MKKFVIIWKILLNIKMLPLEKQIASIIMNNRAPMSVRRITPKTVSRHEHRVGEALRSMEDRNIVYMLITPKGAIAYQLTEIGLTEIMGNLK